MADDRPTRGPQRSVVFPSPVVLLSIVAVAAALIAFVATRDNAPTEQEVVAPARQEQTTTAAPATEAPKPVKKKPKPIQRDKVYVEVYNNSGITGLAASVGGRATDAGWRVVGTDNWFGTIPANTVYFPPRLERAAKQLARDLGVERTAPADGAMKLDRLTLILTGAL